MKLKALALSMFLLAAGPAFAETTTLKCTPVEAFTRSPVKNGLKNYIKSTLEGTGLKDVSVWVSGLRLGAPDPDKTVVTSDYYAAILLQLDPTTQFYSITGPLAEGLYGFDSTCKVKIAHATIKWSGKVVDATGKTTAYKKRPISIMDLTVPGIYVPK